MNTHQNPTATAITDLTHIATHWAVLRDMLTTTTPTTWPPIMGTHHRDQDDEQLLEAAAERAERTAAAPGRRPAPLRVDVLDTITALDDALLSLADEIASSVQRPAFSVRAASPHDVVARSVALMGAKDAADPRRWRFNMAHRDGAVAAAWLADRLTVAAGPFRALSLAQQEQIAHTAASCRRRLDRAIGEAAEPDENGVTTVELDLTCGCGGRLSVTTGQTDFTVNCGSCGLIWTGTSLLNGLSAA